MLFWIAEFCLRHGASIQWWSSVLVWCMVSILLPASGSGSYPTDWHPVLMCKLLCIDSWGWIKNVYKRLGPSVHNFTKNYIFCQSNEKIIPWTNVIWTNVTMTVVPWSSYCYLSQFTNFYKCSTIHSDCCCGALVVVVVVTGWNKSYL